jgi:hypothetical protein
MILSLRLSARHTSPSSLLAALSQFTSSTAQSYAEKSKKIVMLRAMEFSRLRSADIICCIILHQGGDRERDESYLILAGCW